MACENPQSAYQALDGGPIFFNPPKPGTSKQWRGFQIPCGFCILCQEEKARQWAVRIYHEAQLQTDNSFLTLTYSDEKLPEYGSLDYKHLGDFWKRVKQHLVRKHQVKLRYYACGEYGDETQRPHYHACVFGYAFAKDRTIIRADPQLWTSPELEELWGFGNVSVGNLDYGTARYTASYVTKKLRNKQTYVRLDEETGELIPLVQPRGFMSRNIGRTWWDKFRHQVSAHDYVIINGKRQKPPKAYDRWLKERSEIAAEMIKDSRSKHMEKLTPAQTHARAQNAHARAKNKSKSV